ncbi:histidine kinase [Sporosarcina ureilytica]|uniref:Signal transduction histidine-protein kinase/phosphatase DegS n=2 Tax=Sporosarcina ureilytica TaxID=298596 RepID=A0A1D8JKL7_9BACL|nr:histidine kinase [Sporosarcina ureilytica]
MVRTMNQSKNDIYVISEQSRQNYEQMRAELEEVKQDISLLITENDLMEVKSRQSRRRLADVSKNFQSYSEVEVREAYEVASKLQLKLSMNEMEEKRLRKRRDELERQLEGLLETIDRAEQLVTQVATVINYLTSDLKNVGAALEDAKQKQEFSIRIIEAQEEERKRLSRDIHDGPAQMLANVLLRAGLVEKIFNEEGKASALSELKSLRMNVRAALIEVRRVIFDLRPMSLDDLGVGPALKKYLSQIEDFEKDVDIHFQSIGNEQRFHTNFEAAVFRLVQESVANALKHGKPSSIWVKVEWLRDTLNIIIKDNGKGFDVNKVKKKSFGLIGMRERVDLLKGAMKINSTIGKGTIILFQIPLNNEGN